MACFNKGLRSCSLGDDTALVAALDGFVESLDRTFFLDKVGINDGPTKESTKSDTRVVSLSVHNSSDETGGMHKRVSFGEAIEELKGADSRRSALSEFAHSSCN
jgi:hypothetical protein